MNLLPYFRLDTLAASRLLRTPGGISKGGTILMLHINTKQDLLDRQKER